MRVIAFIEDPVRIAKILARLEAHATEPEGCRAPPPGDVVRLTHPLEIEPLGCASNRRGRVGCELRA